MEREIWAFCHEINSRYKTWDYFLAGGFIYEIFKHNVWMVILCMYDGEFKCNKWAFVYRSIMVFLTSFAEATVIF